MDAQQMEKRGRPRGPAKERFEVYLFVHQVERLRALAEKRDQTMAALARRAMEDLLEREGA